MLDKLIAKRDRLVEEIKDASKKVEYLDELIAEFSVDTIEIYADGELVSVEEQSECDITIM